MENRMEEIRPLPEGFEEWCEMMMKAEPVYYKNRSTTAECRCGKCGGAYTIYFGRADETYEEATAARHHQKPVREKAATCQLCGHAGLYEWSRCTKEKVELASFWIVQRTVGNNLTVRVFKCMKRWRNGYSSRFEIQEVRRCTVESDGAGIYWNEARWGKCGVEYGWKRKKRGGMNWGYEEGLYPGWQKEIEHSNQKYFDPVMLNGGRRPRGWEIAQALIAYANNPAVELYAKMGMDRLVEELVRNQGRSRYIHRSGTDVRKQLRIRDGQKIRLLRENKGDMGMLRVLQIEDKTGRHFTDEQRAWMAYRIWLCDGKMRTLLCYMSLQQIMNRCRRYREEYGSENSALIAYADYIKMREELGYDMTNSVYLFPDKLKEKHDRMVREVNAKRDEAYIQKKEAEFDGIPKHLRRLNRKYGYHSGGLLVRPAECAGEIIMEGRILHHCVGGDNYLRKHNNGESAILFLRKETAPGEPYITIEIKGWEIVQWYGAHDKKPDEDRIVPFLEEYLKEIRERGRKKKKLAKAG